jgi:hypothetical protein
MSDASSTTPWCSVSPTAAHEHITAPPCNHEATPLESTGVGHDDCAPGAQDMREHPTAVLAAISVYANGPARCCEHHERDSKNKRVSCVLPDVVEFSLCLVDLADADVLAAAKELHQAALDTRCPSTLYLFACENELQQRLQAAAKNKKKRIGFFLDSVVELRRCVADLPNRNTTLTPVLCVWCATHPDLDSSASGSASFCSAASYDEYAGVCAEVDRE